jgi:biotin transport system substrate-specific component
MTAHTASPVLADAWGRTSRATSATLVIGLTALTAVCAQVSVPLPFTPVPLTLQTFAVLVGAAALGSQRAVVAQLLYVAAALVGLPVLAGGSNAAGGAFGVTGGYVAGFVVSSYVVGRIAQRGATTRPTGTMGAYLAGTAVIYLLGVSWLAYSANMGLREAVIAGMVPFLIGDALKALAAAAVLPAAWRLTRH